MKRKSIFEVENYLITIILSVKSEETHWTILPNMQVKQFLL